MANNDTSKIGETTFYRYMDTIGDGSGNKNFNGDYSLAAEQAILKPPVGMVMECERMLVSLHASKGMTVQIYGSDVALTNGIQIKTADDIGDLKNITDSVPIKKNADWGALCYDVDFKTWGTGNEELLVRFTFSKAGKPIRLDGNRGEKLIVGLFDDHSGSIEHKFQVQGIEYKRSQSLV